MRCPPRVVLLREQLGRRGAVLGAFGTVWLLYGYGQLVEPIPSTSTLRLVLKVAPIDVWAWAWIAAGVTAMVFAWLPRPVDWPGFVALYVLAVPWGLSNLMSWQPFGDNPRGWVGAAIWAAFIAVIRIVAGWEESPRWVERPEDVER